MNGFKYYGGIWLRISKLRKMNDVDNLVKFVRMKKWRTELYIYDGNKNDTKKICFLHNYLHCFISCR